MSPDDLATAIKAEHPLYKDQDNLDLARRWVEKYPTYAKHVDFPKTEEATPIMDTVQKTLELGGTVFGGIAGTAAGATTSPVTGPVGPLVGGVAGAASGRALGTATSNVIRNYMHPEQTPQLSDQFKDVGQSAVQGAKDQATGEAAGAVAKPVISSLGDFVNSGLAKLSKWKLGASVPERAAEIAKDKKFDLPSPTKADIETGVSNVQKALTEAKSKAGAVLNKAKAQLGLPVTVAEREASIAKHGNPFGVSQADGLQQGATAGNPHAIPVYKDNFGPGGAERQIYNVFGDKAHPTIQKVGWGSSVGADILSANKIPIKENGFVKDISKPEDLVKTISEFKAKASEMNPKSRIKLASYLQDKINGMINWEKGGTVTEGILKNQYSDLGDMVNTDAVGIEGPKAEMAKTLKVFDDLESKLADKTKPGAAHDFLKSLFTKESGKNADYLNRLAQLEELSGKPVLTKLFEQFAGESFAKSVGSPKLATAAAVEGATSLLHGNLLGAGGAAGYLAAQSPAAIKAAGKLSGDVTAATLKGLNSKLAIPVGISLKDRLSEKSSREMQSIKDKLNARK